MSKKMVPALVILLAVGESQAVGAGQKRLQVELYGGIAAVAPGDLNSIPEYYNRHFPFYYIDRYEYYRQVGYIQDYDTGLEGRFRGLRWGFPIGLRVRYRATSWLDLSLGVRGFRGSVASRFSIDSRLTDGDGNTSELSRVYDPLKISASGITPLLGLHVRRTITAGIGLEAFLAGGPLFGSISYVRQVYSETGGATPLSFLEEKGNGVGVELEAGLRLETVVGRDLRLFVETGYAHQTASALKGGGFLRSASGEASWEGEWGMKEADLVDYWGAHSLFIASNRWTAEDAPLRQRGFRLDLSGAQVRVGIAVRF